MRHPFLLTALAGMMSLTITAQLRGEETVVAYRDNFSSVKGFRTSQTNGNLREGDLATATRQIYTFMSQQIDGTLKISLLEDDKSEGPDGKPGVLAASYDRVSQSADFSGFVYDGRLGDPIKLPNFDGEVGNEQLKQVKVTFRYKAFNEDESKTGAEYNCRFEVTVEDPYEYRIDFGPLQAKSEWRTFQRTLESGTNHYNFLTAVKRAPEAPFRIVWGQEGEISAYDSGDTLLIDDVKILIVK